MKYSKFLLITLLSLLIVSTVSAQKKKKKIPKNIELIDSKFTFTPIYVNEYSYLKIKSRAYDEAMEMKYKPNTAGYIGGKIQIKNFTAVYIHSLPQPEEFGNTKTINLVFNLQRRNFGLQFFWLRYSGLYIDTLDRYGVFDDLYQKEFDDAFIIRPDIKLNNIGFQTNFIANKNFSLNAAFNQTERQKQTAGSFMLLMGANYTSISNNEDESLILESQQQYFPRISDLYSLKSISFKVAPGIGYSFIIKKYFNLSATIQAGPNFQSKWYRINTSDRAHFSPWLSFYYEGKVAIGYNGKYFMTNLVYSISQDVIGFRKDISDSEYDCRTNFNFYREFLKLSVGFRILN
ncbi:MAG: DUF4421 domain-containing protein [Chlorobi bacterium]|nr:DUF4421 domain-containing protein [Chlorobiota bacterium]